MTWLMLGTFSATAIACAFIGTRLRSFTLIMAALWLVIALWAPVPTLAVWVAGLLLAAILLPLNLPAVRQQHLTARILAQYERMLPPLSESEAAAMETGTVGWERELFSGAPDWMKLRKIPWLELREDERSFLEGPVNELCGMLNDWEITHELRDLPPEVWQFLKDNRFFGLIIPKEYGGLGFSALAHRAVLQKVSSVSSVAGTTVAVPNSLGPGELILHYGTEEQKRHYLPRLARGQDIPCFALTGPTAGSDATSIPDYGIVCRGQYQGKTVLGMRLTFDKRYITLAPVATVIGLAFRLYDPDGLLGKQQDIGISLALMPRATEGLEIGARHNALDIPFQNGPLRGTDVFLPLEALIGGPAMAGKGWRMLVEALSVGRGITLPASSTGGAKMGSLATGAYARIRKQFNQPIGRFEGIEEALARIAGKTYLISALSRMTTTAVDLGEKPAVAAGIAKSHATSMAREIISDVMDVHGGKGVIMGPRNYLGRAWQSAPIWITVEGANILTRNMMIFGQGAIRCHPYVMQEMAATRITDPARKLAEFDRHLWAHAGFTLRNAVRSLLLGLSFGRLARVPDDGGERMASYYRKLSRYSAALAFCADLAMLVLGGKLKQKERLSARLGDALSHLYMSSAVLYRYEAQARPAADQPLVAWAIHHGIFETQRALGGFVENFPNRWLGLLLRVLVFPLGRWEREPGDRLAHRVAQLLLAPSATRDRLANGVYLPADGSHPVALMEQALPLVIASEPQERKLVKAVRAGEVSGLTWEAQLEDALRQGIVNAEEAEALRRAREMTLQIIAVDEFPVTDTAAAAAAPGLAANDFGRRSNAA